MQQFISITLSSASGIFSRVFSLSLAQDPKIISVFYFHHCETIAFYNTILCIVSVSWNNNQAFFFKNQMSNFCSLFLKKVVIQKFKKCKAFRIIYQCHEDTVCYLQFECERMMMMKLFTKMQHFVCACVLSNLFIYNLYMHIPTHDSRRTIQL